MGADAGIFGRLVQTAAPADPLEQYGKVLSMQNLMQNQELHGLQTQVARRGMADEDAVKEAYKASGGNPAVLRTLLYGSGQHKAVEALDKSQLENASKQATMAHTTAQTGQINAGHVAGALAALAQAGGSDEGVANAERIMTQAGAPNAKAVTATLMGMPAGEQRVKYAMAQAASNKVGQDALKILFPAAHMQNFGGTTAPVSTSTLPGSTPGAAVPGGVVTANTQTPDSVASNNRIVSEGLLNRDRISADNAASRGVTMRGQDMTDYRVREGQGAPDKSAKPPAGYRWSADGSSLEQIPGGPADKTALSAGKQAEQNSQMDAVERQIDELRATISANSGVASGVVGPKGAANRVYETVRGVLPGQGDAQTPALTAQSKKELIVANVRKLIAGGGVFSNQDAKRLDNALSMGLMSTEGSAVQGLDDLKQFLKDKRQAQAQSTPAASGTKPKAEDFFR